MSYTKPEITGYNQNPPPDNGTTGADNEITWAKHKTKLGDPVKTYADAINQENSDAWDDLASTDTDDGNKGFNLVSIPPLTGETGVENHAYALNNALRYIPWNLHADIRAETSATDVLFYLNNLRDSGHAELHLPKGEYITSAAWVIDSNQRIIGVQPTRISGGTHINNTGTGDCIQYSDTTEIYDSGIENVALTSTTGHALNLKWGAARCRFINLRLYTKAADKSCVAGDYSSGTISVNWLGTYSCLFEGGEYIVDNVTRTAPIIDFQANNTAVNENVFRNFWLTQSKGIQAIRLLCNVGGGVYLTNNKFSALSFEICAGGGFFLQGTSHTSISSISFWDNAPGYDGDLIEISSDTGASQNRGLLIENVARIGNSLNGAAVDINLGFSLDTTIINHSPQSSANAIIDCKNRSSVIIGGANATVNNSGATSFIKGVEIKSGSFVDLNGTWSSGPKTSTTAALTDITDAVNTSSEKVFGYSTFDITARIPVWADGNADGSVWLDATGATVYTPV